MIKGVTVTLINDRQIGEDPFGNPIVEEVTEEVNDVLVSPSSQDEIVYSVSLYGKKAVITLAIPKGDEHEWEDSKIKAFGKVYRTFGPVIQGIEENIPLRWNKKIMCESYE